MATNATYKRYNGSGWEIFYFKTSAGQVGVSSTRKFITSSTTVNGKAFTLAANDSNAASVTIDGGDIGCGISQNLNYISTNLSIAEALADLDTACKAAYDHVPVNVLTTDSQLDVTKLVGVISEANLPDYILGQLMYGGTLGASHTASLSSKAKAKLGTTANTLELVNSNGTSTPNTFTSNEGIYYIVTVAQTFANLDLNVGDWLVATSSGWKKVDNTDAIASWCGLTGNITIAQAKFALGGSIASGNDGFATGGAVYNKYVELDSKKEFIGPITVRAVDHNSYDAYLYFKASNGEDTYHSEAYIVSDYDDDEQTQDLKIHSTGPLYLEAGDFSFKKVNHSYSIGLTGFNNLTNSRDYAVPDKSGTLALTSDLPTVNNSTITIQKNGIVVESFALNQSSGKNINITMSKSDVGLGNVDNTSDATKKSNFTGSIASGNTGFATGDAVYTALANKLSNPDPSHLDTYIDSSNHETGFVWNIDDSSFSGFKCVYDDGEDTVTSKLGFQNGQITLYSQNGIFISTTYYDDMQTWGVYLRTDNVQGTKYVQFPNKDGTIAMLSDVPTFTIGTSQPSNPKAGDVWIETDA